MGINNVPLILMGINTKSEDIINPHYPHWSPLVMGINTKSEDINPH